MGACCCGAKEGEPANDPHLGLPDEQSGAGSSVVDINLHAPFPDTFRAPPTPIPYDAVLGRPVSPLVTQEMSDDKSGGDDVTAQTMAANPDSVQEAGGDDVQDPSAEGEVLKEPDCTELAEPEVGDKKEQAAGPSKAAGPSRAVGSSSVVPAEEEDGCPICLDEYTTTNPQLVMRCEHHFHLACLLSWMERRDTCPVCDQKIDYDQPANSDSAT